MAISRMQEPQQIQSGIGSLQDPRQKYFLGKLVKKAGRAVKKVVKSPLGKMALIGGLGYGLGGAKFLGGKGIFAGGQGLGRFSNLLNLVKPAATNVSGKKGLLSSLFYDKAGDFSLGRTALTGLGATALAAPFLMGGGDEEEEVTDVMDPRYQVQRAKNFYSGKGDAGAGLDFMPQKKYVMQNFYAADGGLADIPRDGYANGMMVEDEEEEFIRSGAGQKRRMPQTFLNMGGGAGEAQAEQMLMMEYVKYKNKGGDLSFEQFVKAVMQASQQPEGAGMEQPEAVAMAADGGLMTKVPGYGTPAGTNKFDYPSGGEEVRVGKQEGGIMEAEASEMIDMGGMEKDKFTADAVRNAGGGDIDKGAEVMENLMNNLEQGGEISEGSQGLEGAQAMYDQQQMLQSRII